MFVFLVDCSSFPFMIFVLKSTSSDVTMAAAAAAKLLQSCPALRDPMDCSLLGFSVHGILQVRTLELVAISFYGRWY